MTHHYNSSLLVAPCIIRYTFIETLFAEVAAAFPDAVFNIGGDEVSPGCYEENPEVAAYLTQHNMTGDELVATFARRVFVIVGKLGKDPMMWIPGIGTKVNFADTPPGAIYDV